MSDRGLDPKTALAIDRLRKETRPYWGRYGPIVDVTFSTAATVRDVQHGLEQVPDGYHVVWADGIVHAEPGVLWTKTLAFLQASTANVHAKLVFFTLKETRNEP